ncbi:hypothetical protein K493DRAFT_299689 [Basidiobolus meristosporus CBS 931.73]|uniref:F-box domain-containing protein n=1 Tax=Basidiobolus meristosporus CBS 931.73 TaxID=1314790 RepID=A0A1Y1YM46_9FUNG|nr:hypothetical protein K493DRAFT_299689 [Basidiobolus meristosporus CBS 931.73]|eukprot:ORX98923.1 hypothetical protein K493DRAFT_299689 [Basidiobolus meristosporus CBS 931.73]
MNSLPIEVLHEIIGWLDKSHDLATCCLVNKAWTKVATPCLWYKPVLHDTESFELFLDVVKHPELSWSKLRYVQELALKQEFLEILISKKLFTQFVNLKVFGSEEYNWLLHAEEHDLYFPLLREARNYVMNFTSWDIFRLGCFLHKSPLLKSLSLELSGLPFGFLVPGIPQTRQLRALFIRWNTEESDPQLVDATEEQRASRIEGLVQNMWYSLCSNLQEFSLEFTGESRNPEVPISFSGMPWTDLTYFKLARVGLTSQAFLNLANTLSPALTTLKLSWFTPHEIIPDIHSFYQLLNSCGENLVTLQLENHFLPVELGELISRTCPRLRRLIINATNFDDVSFLHIVNSLAEQLEYIEVSSSLLEAPSLLRVLKLCRPQALKIYRNQQIATPIQTPVRKEFFCNLREVSLLGYEMQNDFLEHLRDSTNGLRKFTLDVHQNMNFVLVKSVCTELQRRSGYFFQPISQPSQRFLSYKRYDN